MPIEAAVFLKCPVGQTQLCEALTLRTADDRFGALHDRINPHLGDDLSVAVLAGRRTARFRFIF